MGDSGLRASSETGHNEVLEGRGWKTPETIDAARCSEEVALFGVVGYQVAAKAQFTAWEAPK